MFPEHPKSSSAGWLPTPHCSSNNFWESLLPSSLPTESSRPRLPKRWHQGYDSGLAPHGGLRPQGSLGQVSKRVTQWAQSSWL